MNGTCDLISAAILPCESLNTEKCNITVGYYQENCIIRIIKVDQGHQVHLTY